MALSKLINKIMRYVRCTIISIWKSMNEENICQLHGASTFSLEFAVQLKILLSRLLFVSWNLQLRKDKYGLLEVGEGRK
jgi:hypothetical protein